MIPLPIVADSTLPVCRHRGPPTSEGHFACSTIWLRHGPLGAHAETCARCPYIDRPNPDIPTPAPPETFDCLHRGPVARVELCQACGGRDLPVDVHYCALHGECTVHARQLRRGGEATGKLLDVCISCDDRRAPSGGPPGAEGASGTRAPAARAVTLRMPLAPGDNVVATAAVYELHKAYPGQFAVTIETYYPEIWEHNPGVAGLVPAEQSAGPDVIELSSQATIDTAESRPVHYLAAYCRDLSEKLRLPKPLEITEFRGHVTLSPAELISPNQVEQLLGNSRRPWWIVNAGCKQDTTCKQWPREHFQAVIDHFRSLSSPVQRDGDNVAAAQPIPAAPPPHAEQSPILFVQVGSFDTDSGGHVHPPLDGVLDLRGQTTHRQLAQLVYHTDGVLCGNTYLMHLVAAIDAPYWRPGLRPAVILGGGREGVQWYQYPGHQVLHSISAYDCCATGGCWKDRVVALGDGSFYDHESKRCRQPMETASGSHARCLAETGPEQVIAAIERFASGRPDVYPRPRKTIYIAHNGTREAGHFLGDTLVAIKVAWSMVAASQADRVLLSLHRQSEFNCFWARFIATYQVEVVYDDLPVGDQGACDRLFDERRAARQVNGVPFDVYRELYRRIDGATRQQALCGSEQGLGRKNIFQYFFCGQEGAPQPPADTTICRGDLIHFETAFPPADPRAVFIAPEAKSQGTDLFTRSFWERVARQLLDAGIRLTVNTREPFLPAVEDPRLARTFLAPEQLPYQVAAHAIVLSGNTGIGWVAAATGTPLMAMQPLGRGYQDYRYDWCGVESLVRIFEQPDAAAVALAAEAYVGSLAERGP